MAQVHDDWEVAVDTGEFDKQLERQEKDRAATKQLVVDSQPTNSMNFLSTNKPIRILKRPGSQTPLSSTTTSNDVPAPMVSPFADDLSTSETNIAPPVITTVSSSQTNRIPMKTYEQRELEYRLARRRIMGEEESEEKETTNDETNLLSNDNNLRTSAALDSSS